MLSAKAEAAVMLIDVNKGAAGVTSAGKLAWVSPAHASSMGARDEVLLGRRTQAALPPSFLNPRYAKTASNAWCYAASVLSPEHVSMAHAPVAGFVGLRELIATVSSHEASMAGQARNLLLWHKQHAFCGQCGSPSKSAKGGWKRVCTGCGAQHFPRTDPVIISAVLSPDGTRCLLGRQRKWPKGWLSCLAGFVDPGETVEEAVCREVKEEAGVRVLPDSITYCASQPWPNGPSGQLMLGFVAVAEHESLAVNLDELEMATWVDVAQVREALTQRPASSTPWPYPVRVPPPEAIANSLLAAACEAAQLAADG